MSFTVTTQSLNARLFISNQPQVFPDQGSNPDLGTPDDTSVIWPIPRDAKTDVAVLLRLGLEQFGNPVGSIPVIKDGTFQQSLLRMYDVSKKNDLAHAPTVSQPVIQVARAGDVARRISVSELAEGHGRKTSEGGDIVTDSETIPEDAEIYLRHQVSDVTIEINIYDTKENRADQLYLLIKTLMFAAEKTFMSLGYLNVLRLNGVDNAGLTLDVPGGEALIFVRTLTYLMTHMDFIAGIATLGNLIGQELTIETVDGNDQTLESDFP
jgi:hypothetical protein